MNVYEDCLIEAIDLVSGWDIPADQFADVVNSQVRLMAGMPPEWCPTSPATDTHDPSAA